MHYPVSSTPLGVALTEKRHSAAWRPALGAWLPSLCSATPALLRGPAVDAVHLGGGEVDEVPAERGAEAIVGAGGGRHAHVVRRELAHLIFAAGGQEAGVREPGPGPEATGPESRGVGRGSGRGAGSVPGQEAGGVQRSLPLADVVGGAVTRHGLGGGGVGLHDPLFLRWPLFPPCRRTR